MRLKKLIVRSETAKEVMEEIQRFPRWYLQNKEQRRLNKLSLEALFKNIKDVVK